MKIAFDLDGTLSKHRVLIKLALLLKQTGADVFILTAAAGELLPAQRPAEVRRRCDKLGLTEFEIVCCESAEKPEYCKRLGVDLLIDDTQFRLPHGLQLLVT